MPRKHVNIGTNPNDSTGDTLRVAFTKINDNFSELYGETAADSQISFSGNKISANASNADLVLEGSGTGGVQLGALRVDGTSISSDDSTVVNINEDLIVEGTITSRGVIIADEYRGDGSNLTGITADQIGDLTTIGSTITSPSNADLTLATSGTGSISLDGIQIKGTSISSTDSTQININENVNVDGNLVFTGSLTGDGSGLTGITATTVSTPFSVDNLNFDDNIISSDSNADIIVNPGGTGAIELQANTNIDGDATATTFIGAMRGATVFQAKATEDISKGEAVYISGLSGNTPEVALARANSASTMPAFGIAESDIANTATGNIVTFGSCPGHDVADFGETSITFALGDTVYVSSAEAGKLTNVAPTGESNLIQNIGKIERVAPTTNMTIKVGGAGRTNATPALNDGNIFIGNGSNQASTVSLATQIKSYTGLTVVGDDSTGTSLNIGETFKVAGATGVTTAVSGDTLTITGPNLSSYLTDTTLNVVADDSATIAINNNGTLLFNGEQNITTSTDSSGVVTITGPDLSSYITASSSDTLTNKTIDANGTGNSITNLEVADFAAATIVTAGEGIGSNNNDTTIPTSAAVKAYADSVGGAAAIGDLTITGSTISSPSNAPLTLDPSGTGKVTAVGGLVVTGGDTETADISSSGQIDAVGFTATGSSTFDGVQITDNTISSAASNADLQINASGTGTVVLENLKVGTGATVTTILDEDNMSSNSATALATQQSIKAYVDAQNTAQALTFVGDDSSGTAVNTGETFKFAGATGVTTAVSGDTLTITGPDLSSYITASSSDTLTNKTFDVEGTGNSISNIDVADFKAAAIVTEAEGIGSNDNDTTIPTSAAVKDYVDNNAGGTTGDLTITGSTISAPSNADLTLNAGGTGSVDIDGIQIKGTSISSTDSTQININENVNIDGTLTVSGSTLSGTLNTAGNTGTGSVALASESLQVTGTTNEINVEAAAFALTMSLADNISGITSVTASSFLANDAIKIDDNKITGLRSNEDIHIDPAGTGGIVAQAAMTFNKNAIFNTGVEEKFATLTGSTGTVTHNCDNGHVFYHTGASGDITANFTNLGLTAEYGTNLTVIINQGATPYEVTAVQIGGAAQTINWQGGSAPTGNANGIDSFSFTILNDGGTYVVLGQMVDFT